MTKWVPYIGHSPIINETATGTSRDFPEMANYDKALIFTTVTAMGGTNQTLNVNVQYKDPTTFGATAQYINVQSRLVGINANGTMTTGSYALGTIDQVTNATALPWTEARAITASEIMSGTMRFQWVIGGTGGPNFTFGILLLAKTEE